MAPAVAAPVRVPASDRIVEAQAPLLDESKRKRRDRNLRDAVKRQRGPGRHPLTRPEHGIAGRPAPHAPVGEHDRRRGAGNARILDPVPELRVHALRHARRQPWTRRRPRLLAVAPTTPAPEEQPETQAGEERA